MSADTTFSNQAMTHFDSHDSLWLFGYGSLLYKVDFPYLERKPARIINWSRRFWQGSHDHRGTLQNPGRVVTLVETPSAVCEGIAYRITPEEFAHLDHREKNGYLRVITDIHFNDAAAEAGVTYIAHPDNSAFLGPATEREIAQHIASACGPSGDNAEYLFKLAEALRQLNEVDRHVFAIEQYLLNLRDDTA